ncbi:putative PIF1 DNA helicase/replication protein A1-like protein [Tanacetum coccineum]
MKAIFGYEKESKSQPKENKTQPNENYAAITRYLLACEAAWRIYGFDIHYRFPHVETLPFHLPNEQSIIFDESDSLDYTLDKALVNETKFQASLYACYAHGLLEDDKEYIDGLLEASHWGIRNYLRRFFVMLIMTDSMSWLEFVYEKTWHVMATDVESIEGVKKNDPVVKAGSGGHTVVQTEDGCSFSFGWNKHGQLGTGSIKNEVELSPVQCLITDVRDVACGNDFTVWLTSLKGTSISMKTTLRVF